MIDYVCVSRIVKLPFDEIGYLVIYEVQHCGFFFFTEKKNINLSDKSDRLTAVVSGQKICQFAKLRKM